MICVSVVLCVMCMYVWMCSLGSNDLKAAGVTALVPHLASVTALQKLG